MNFNSRLQSLVQILTCLYDIYENSLWSQRLNIFKVFDYVRNIQSHQTNTQLNHLWFRSIWTGWDTNHVLIWSMASQFAFHENSKFVIIDSCWHGVPIVWVKVPPFVLQTSIDYKMLHQLIKKLWCRILNEVSTNKHVTKRNFN